MSLLSPLFVALIGAPTVAAFFRVFQARETKVPEILDFETPLSINLENERRPRWHLPLMSVSLYFSEPAMHDHRPQFLWLSLSQVAAYEAPVL